MPAVARFGLILMLLFGLVLATPVVCVCGPTDHGGQALHSLLPHTHEHPHDQHAAVDTVASDDVVLELRAASVSPQTGAGAGALAASGAIGLTLAQPWQLVPTTGGRMWPSSALAPAEPLFEPPGPPPRQTLGSIG